MNVDSVKPRNQRCKGCDSEMGPVITGRSSPSRTRSVVIPPESEETVVERKRLLSKFYATGMIASISVDEMRRSGACTNVIFMARCIKQEMKKVTKIRFSRLGSSNTRLMRVAFNFVNPCLLRCPGRRFFAVRSLQPFAPRFVLVEPERRRMSWPGFRLETSEPRDSLFLADRASTRVGIRANRVSCQPRRRTLVCVSRFMGPLVR